MCPDVLRGPSSRVFVPTDQFLKCDPQQTAFNNPALESLLYQYDEREMYSSTCSALLHHTLSCDLNQQPGAGESRLFSNYQPMQCDSPRLTEIDSGWMLLEDLPIISQEVSPIPGPDLVTQFPQYSPFNHPLALPLDQLTPGFDGENKHLPPTSVAVVPQELEIPKSRPTEPKYLPTQSPSLHPPNSLKARGSRRSERQQKPKKMPKWSREANLAPSEQVEHVLRERQRRDDMSCKISILEGLLPPCPKRDRASIVHDSVQYVKNLQQELEELQRKFDKLKRNSLPSTPLPRTDIVELPYSTSTVFSDRVQTSCNNPAAGISGSISDKKFYVVEFHVQLEGYAESAKLMKCVCRPDYLSIVMKTMGRLKLDICRCSVMKMFDHFICVVVAKVRVPLRCCVPSCNSFIVPLCLSSVVESVVCPAPPSSTG